MASDSQQRLLAQNGLSNGHGIFNGTSNGFGQGFSNGSANPQSSKTNDEVKQLDEQLKKAIYEPAFHGDNLIGVCCFCSLRRRSSLTLQQDKIDPGVGTLDDLRRAFAPKNWPEIRQIVGSLIRGEGPNVGVSIDFFIAQDPITKIQ